MSNRTCPNRGVGGSQVVAPTNGSGVAAGGRGLPKGVAHKQGGERGMSESLQWAVLAPMIMLLLLGLIETGVWLHGRSIVQQAALTAAETQALVGAPSSSAESTVEQMTDELESVHTYCITTEADVTVTVTADIPLPLDFGFGQVTVSATRAKER